MDTSFGARVRQRRQRAGWTLEAFAKRSGASRAALSKIERGERRPGLGTAVRIADALGVPLPELLGREEGPAVQVLRDTSPAALVDEVSGAMRESLFPAIDGVEIVRYTVPAAGTAGPFHPHATGTREVFAVIEGTVTIQAGTDRVDLAAGELAAVPGDVTHVLANGDGDRPARLILIIIPRHESGADAGPPRPEQA